VNEVRTVDGIATDADAGRLAKPDVRGLEHRLIGQGSRPRHNPDRPRLVDVTGHDADLALFGSDDAGTVGSDEAGARALQRPLHPDHVQNRNAFCYADDKRDLRCNRLENRIGGERRWHIYDTGVGLCRGPCLSDGIEDRQAQMFGSALPRRDTAHHARSVGNCLFGVKGAGLAGDPLADDSCIPVDENGHRSLALRKRMGQAACFTAATILRAASSRSSAAMTLRPDCEMMLLPFSTLVPSRRTTCGTCSPTSLTAATTPSAITSHRMMPPKMFTRIPCTLGSAVMILNAAVTFSFVAPPPTSRKLAG